MPFDMSRRRLMTTGAGLGAAAAAAAALPATAAHADTAAPADAPPSNPAAVPTGVPLISVSDGSNPWLSGVRNHDTSTTVQGLAFDSVNGHMYTLQIAGASTVSYSQSGTQVASSGTVSGDQHATSGDLCLTQHDMTGAVTGVMFLLGFGHGVSLGVQPASGSTPAYIWTEADAQLSGYGNAIVRFPFASGKVLWPSHPSVQRAGSPMAGAGSMTPSVDAVNNILLIRFVYDGDHWFAAYPLDQATTATAAGQPLPDPLAVIEQPALYQYDANGKPTTTPATFQGFTSFGQYVYLLDGAPRTSDPSAGLTGVDEWAIHTTSMDLNGTLNGAPGSANAGFIQTTHSAADANANPREPEGMAIWTGSGAPRLAFAISNNDGSTRQFDLYYKV